MVRILQSVVVVNCVCSYVLLRNMKLSCVLCAWLQEYFHVVDVGDG